MYVIFPFLPDFEATPKNFFFKSPQNTKPSPVWPVKQSFFFCCLRVLFLCKVLDLKKQNKTKQKNLYWCNMLKKLWSVGQHIKVYYHVPTIKGALDKSNIYFFISSSIKDWKPNLYRKFQLILPMRFHFMRYFVKSIIFRVPHRLLNNCVFIEVDFEK